MAIWHNFYELSIDRPQNLVATPRLGQTPYAHFIRIPHLRHYPRF